MILSDSGQLKYNTVSIEHRTDESDAFLKNRKKLPNHLKKLKNDLMTS